MKLNKDEALFMRAQDIARAHALAESEMRARAQKAEDVDEADCHVEMAEDHVRHLWALFVGIRAVCRDPLAVEMLADTGIELTEDWELAPEPNRQLGLDLQ